MVICCTPLMVGAASSSLSVALQPVEKLLAAHQVDADLCELVEAGIRRTGNGVGGEDDAEIPVGSRVDRGPRRGREVGAAENDGGDAERLQVIFKRGLEEGGEARLVAKPF